MYESHFGLRHRPFRSTPDCAQYYPATGHEAALAQLQEALAGDEGVALLTGDPGMGKTLLCHCLLHRVGEAAQCAVLTNSHLANRSALFQAILYDLGLSTEGSEQDLRLRLTDNLLTHCAGGGTTLLVVDEAHHLSADLLEELRLLANLASGDGRAIQVLLAGLPTLLDALEHPTLSVLRQRLTARASVVPLEPTEAADYLLHHLRAAHDHPDRLIAEDALEILARGTHGVPRLLNQSAHRAFQLAHGAGARSVDAEAALEALTILGLEMPEEESADCFEEKFGHAA